MSPPAPKAMAEWLVLLQAYGNPQEAELVRGLLESHGIDVFLADEHIARLGTHLPMGGVKLQVREADLEEARAILREALSGTASPLEGSIGDHACPICGGQRSEAVSDPVRLAIGLMLAGIPLLVWRPKRRCQICGNVWRG